MARIVKPQSRNHDLEPEKWLLIGKRSSYYFVQTTKATEGKGMFTLNGEPVLSIDRAASIQTLASAFTNEGLKCLDYR